MCHQSIGNLVTNILVYYKSFYANYYLRKWHFLHCSKLSDMSSRKKNTLHKNFIFFSLSVAITWRTIHQNKALCMFYTPV